MKGEYTEPKGEPNSNPAAMFSKTIHPFSGHHFHPSEDDSAATSRPSGSPTIPISGLKSPTKSSSGDGATIEVVRRPRGRPPGSKNKPKAAVVVAREPEPAMSPYILEIPGGADIVESISRFCRRKGMGLCVLTGSGTVANCTLRQPSASNVPPGATVTFHGRFEILSVSATFLRQTVALPVPNGFSISLAGPQGQIVGGYVAGPLVAAGTVFIVATSFNNPSYHRLMQDEHEEGRKSPSDGHSPPPSGGSGSGNLGHHHQHGQEDGMPTTMFSTHMPTSDAMWATMPLKQQHHHHHPPHPHPF